MNKFYFSVMLALCFIALICGALWTTGHAWWIAVVVLAAAGAACSFLSLLAQGGSSKSDREDATRYGMWATALLILAVICEIWIGVRI